MKHSMIGYRMTSHELVAFLTLMCANEAFQEKAPIDSEPTIKPSTVDFATNSFYFRGV